MDAQVSTTVLCCVCKQFLDTLAPHAIVKSDYAHIDCADAYDARAWKWREFEHDPADLMGSQWPDIDDGE